MVQVLAATFKDGVFKPDEQPALAESARVRLVVETISDDGDDSRQREQSWAALQKLWETSNLKSNGDRLTRDQFHKRR
jgi:predicted DNA-binding antitoxin AbrB/MazE fold protein